MKIVKEANNQELIIKPSGEINSVTAPELEEVIRNDLGNVKKLVFDFAELDYLSSAGLRVLLAAYKTMSKQGTMVIRNANDNVMDSFQMTGFTNFLTIEN